MPEVGKAMSVFVREVITIQENLFSMPSSSREFVVAHVVNNHEPSADHSLANVSTSIYIRQDPFKETIYLAKHNILLVFAQIVGALAFIYAIGYLLTIFWTRYRFKASLIKGLYKVKHSSILP